MVEQSDIVKRIDRTSPTGGTHNECRLHPPDTSSRLVRFLFTTVLLISTTAVAENRLQIDTHQGTLTVLDHNTPILVLDGIAIGRFGASRDKMLGDGMTPLGSYHVTSIKRSRRFHFFIGLDYPSVADADRGLKNAILTPSQADAIRAAHAKGKLPPQDTPLGGHIGLHGIGDGDPAVHARYNWTKGCVAVTDDQLDQLLPLIRVGTRVEIK
jgi:murein L,D-transpeptidase YafK